MALLWNALRHLTESPLLQTAIAATERKHYSHRKAHATSWLQVLQLPSWAAVLDLPLQHPTKPSDPTLCVYDGYA